ncbi:unnamed protein product [Effrenium voratum]|nr:unnamed protein product [Effrenium voratum]
MVKDIFGRDRFHCTSHGCSCGEFQSEAQRDIARAEEEGITMEEMESRYHSMTCQAKSMYQLTCVCGHDANSHSQKQLQTGPGGKPKEAEVYQEEAGAWKILQGLCFRKDGTDPRAPQIKRLKRSGELELGAGRWRGPNGGLWAELACEPEPGWVLLEGFHHGCGPLW